MVIEAITVCVNYSDFLAWFLLSNAKLFDRLVVVTDTQDRKPPICASTTTWSASRQTLSTRVAWRSTKAPASTLAFGACR